MCTRFRSSPFDARPVLPARAQLTFLACLCSILPVGCGTELREGEIDADGLPWLEVVEELRIGSIDDPELGFSNPSAVDVDRDGFIYVLERQDRNVRVYDAAGNRVRTIGGPGQGPGEFESPLYFGVLGDTVWVNDTRLRRITLFTRDGQLISTADATGVIVPTPPGISLRVRPTRMRPDGLLVGTGISAVMIGANIQQDYVRPTLLFDLNGQVVDTIRVDTIPAPGLIERSEPLMVDGIPLPRPSPPNDRAFSLDTRDGVVTVERAHATTASDGLFAITRTLGSGDTVYHRVFRYAPRAYDAQMIDSLIAARAESYREQVPDVDAHERAIRDTWEFPAFQAPISDAELASDESVWLRRNDEGGDYTWIVVDPQGHPRGQFNLPRGAMIRWATADQAWVVIRDDYDVPWLLRYALRG